MALFRALKHRPFTLLWSGQTISRLGDSLYLLALSWWVLEKTGSATAAGSVLIVSFTPTLIFLLIGGVAADRFSRRRMMLISDFLRGVLVFGIAGMAANNRLELWHIYFASLIFGVVDAFFNPAFTAIIPELTPSELLTSANSLFQLGNRFAGIVGPTLGAVLVAIGGTSLAFALDGVSFFVAAACVLLIGNAQVAPPVEVGRRPGVLHDLRDGFAIVLASTWLWLTIALAGVGNLFSVGAVDVAIPFFVKNELQADVGTLGVLRTALAVGSIVGTAWIGSRRLKQRGLWIYISFIIGASMFSVLGWSRSLWIALPAMFMVGVGGTVCALCWTNALQEYVPREKLGRVYSIDQMGSFIMIPVGYGVAGWMTDHMSAGTTLVVSGILSVLIIGSGLLSRSIRALD